MTTQQQAYIDEGLRAGIPLEVMTEWLSRNPGDYHRIMSALGGTQSNVVASTLDRDVIALSATSSPGLPGAIGGIIDVIAPHLPGNWGGIIGGIGDVLFPGGGSTLPQFPSFQLPLPGTTAPRPALPPAGGVPRAPAAGRIVINVPGRGPVSVSARRAAIVAAAAAALGLTVEQYLALNPGAGREHRRLNVLNPKALRRAGRRVEGFACFAKKMISFSEKTRIKGVRKGCRRKKCA